MEPDDSTHIGNHVYSPCPTPTPDTSISSRARALWEALSGKCKLLGEGYRSTRAEYRLLRHANAQGLAWTPDRDDPFWNLITDQPSLPENRWWKSIADQRRAKNDSTVYRLGVAAYELLHPGIFTSANNVAQRGHNIRRGNTWEQS